MPEYLQIRRPERSEINQLITCMTEARGLNYYSAGQLNEDYLFSDDFELYGAFLDNNEIAGFAGLTHGIFGSEMSTLTLLNVRHGFTGCGIATALLTHLVTVLSKRNIKAIKGNAAAWHSSVQHILEELGLRPTGLLCGVKDGNKITPSAAGKCSLVVIAKKVLIEHPVIIYLHKDILQSAKSAYDSIDVKAEYRTTGVKSGKSILTHSYKQHDNVMYTQVVECGDDLTEKLNHTATGYVNPSGFTSIILLNIETPSAIYGYQKILELGYKFSGFDTMSEFEYAIFYKCFSDIGILQTTERIETFLQNAGIII